MFDQSFPMSSSTILESSIDNFSTELDNKGVFEVENEFWDWKNSITKEI